MAEPELSKHEIASKEFNKVVDSTSEFLKAVFPLGYKWRQQHLERKKLRKAKKDAEARKKSEFKV